MDSPISPGTHGAARAAAFGATLRQAFIAYARWLDSISWKRFFLLCVLAMIVAGVMAQLPPFSTEWGGHRVIERVVEKTPRIPKSKEATGVHGSTKAAGGYRIDIDKLGVHIRPNPSGAASAASGASSIASTTSGSAPDATATAQSPAAPAAPVTPVTPTTPDATERGVHIQLPADADIDDIKQAIEDAQAEVEDQGSETKTRFRYEEGFSLGDYLPQFTFLLEVLSLVIKIMAAGRFKAEAKAEVATGIAESETLKRQVVEARMAAMQAQVEPHFLFNTLASIDHLIETDPARASQMQKNLIALLRASMPAMREAHPTAHNLGREMAVIRPYLEILKVRMEDRLQIDVNVPEGLLSAEFPSMMIQSLVENAIKHGLEPKAEGGKLTVRAEIVHGKLAVTVADTGLGFGKAATAGTGTGLNNIRERLKLLYGSRASMIVTENAPSGTVVTLTVPYQAQSREGVDT